MKLRDTIIHFFRTNRIEKIILYSLLTIICVIGFIILAALGIISLFKKNNKTNTDIISCPNPSTNGPTIDLPIKGNVWTFAFWVKATSNLSAGNNFQIANVCGAYPTINYDFNPIFSSYSCINFGQEIQPIECPYNSYGCSTIGGVFNTSCSYDDRLTNNVRCFVAWSQNDDKQILMYSKIGPDGTRLYKIESPYRKLNKLYDVLQLNTFGGKFIFENVQTYDRALSIDELTTIYNTTK